MDLVSRVVGKRRIVCMRERVDGNSMVMIVEWTAAGWRRRSVRAVSHCGEGMPWYCAQLSGSCLEGAKSFHGGVGF